MRRLLLASAAAFLALTAPAAATTIALPPPAHVHFDLGPGVGSKVTTYAYGADQRMEVVRQGQVVAQSTGTSGGRGRVMTPGLVAGDVANVYVGGTLRLSATFDGTPTLDGACTGRSSFTFTRGGLGHQWRAGLLTPLDYPRDGAAALRRRAHRRSADDPRHAPAPAGAGGLRLCGDRQPAPERHVRALEPHHRGRCLPCAAGGQARGEARPPRRRAQAARPPPQRHAADAADAVHRTGHDPAADHGPRAAAPSPTASARARSPARPT